MKTKLLFTTCLALQLFGFAPVSLAQTPELHVAAEVTYFNGRLRYAIVRSDGEIVVSGRFAGNEGDPFSRFLVLGSDGHVVKRVFSPGIYPLVPGNEADYYYQPYSYCDIAFEDGSFIVETLTWLTSGNFETTAYRPLHLNADGTVDDGFNARFGTNAVVFSSLIQSDGKLLFAGAFGGAPVRRTFRDGSPDPEFTQQVSSAGLSPLGFDVAIGTSGKIWLKQGDFIPNGFTNKPLVRLNSDGSLDTGFTAPTFDLPPSFIPQADGKLLVFWGAGQSAHIVNDTNLVVLTRLNEDGSLDSGFKLDPDLFSGFVDGPSANGFALMPDGKIVIGLSGTVMDGGDSVERTTKRLFPDGRLDAAFQDRLKANCLSRLIPQPDGKLLVLHRSSCGLFATRDYLSRLNDDGSVDSTFDATAVNADYIGPVEVAVAGARKGFRYAFEASTDLRTWTKVDERGPLQVDPAPDFTLGFLDYDAGRFRQRFYRVLETAQ